MTKLQLPEGYQDIAMLQGQLQQISSEQWAQRGAERALELFHAMATRVPAYKEFLASRHFDVAGIKTTDDLVHIPTVDKDNYLKAYPKEKLCWDGTFPAGQWVISSTSGSSGQPYYFPRQLSQDVQYAVTAELYLRSNFKIHERSTLYIVAFPMGAWIGGVYTYEALKLAAQNGGYSLSIITPGIHKQEVIAAIKQLGKHYDQIIIGAYAPFLKDILDDGEREGIDWGEHQLGFVFSAEAFSEVFRDYVINKTGIKDVLRSTLNHYGTVDLGTMAHETPESVMIRRHLVANDGLTTLFPEDVRQPTFAQYNPELFYFEEIDGNLLCSAYSGIPLMRYDLKDYGGIMSRATVHQKLAAAGFDVVAEAQQAGIDDTLWNLPFVYIYERNDFSVSYYAFLVYPDTVRRCFEDKTFHNDLTGKFSMQVDYDENGRQHLIINAEMKHGLEASDELSAQLAEALHDQLTLESSEYRETFQTIGPEAQPIVALWPYEDPAYFKAGAKQKWVVK
jgi:phenylacetate-CoA ligase